MRTSKKSRGGGSWGMVEPVAAAAAPAAPAVASVPLAPVRRHAPTPAATKKRSLGALIFWSFVWFVVILGLLVAAFLLWRHFHRQEKLSSLAVSLTEHSTAAALGVLAAAFLGATLFTWNRATAQAIGLLAVVVFATGTVGGAYLWGIESLNAVGTHTKAGAQAAGLLEKLGSTDQPAVALIAGYDQRAGTGSSSYAGSNSDTLMLLRADPKNNTLSLLSFPRDLNVPIYCKGDTIATYNRINAAWAICGANGGPYAAVDTIEHLTGMQVKVNYLITLDFNAFQQIVDRLGGVFLNVDRRYYIAPNTGTSEIDLHPGYQRLNGAQALSYVRFRHLDSDIYRNGRQQLFMESFKQRLKSTMTLSNLGTIPRIMKAVKDNLEVIKPGEGKPTLGEVNAYLGLLLGLPPGHLLRNAIPPSELSNYFVGGASELQASPEAVARAVHSFLHPAVPAAPHAHTGGKGTKTPSLPHKNISVLVLNAGNRNGEASHTSYLLGRHGFVTKTLPASIKANARKKTRNTVVYYDQAHENGEKAARVLASLFGANTRVAEMTPGIALYAQKAGGPLTVVAVGTGYRGRLKLGHRTKPLSTSTANAQVQDGLPITLSAVQAQDGPAHFSLMVPHAVAVGSSLSTDEGVRLFRPLRGKQELVLTFNLNGGIEYWQIEESDWTTEPLLAAPTAHFVYKGRKYDVFTTGGKIQTIAVHDGHSVYWVQNTILNSLSNATMIAIAKGLQPLHPVKVR